MLWHTRIDHIRITTDTCQWALSICLFHLKFGGNCLDVELQNNRPTNGSRDRWEIAAAELRRNYVDPIDTVVYQDAKKRLDADLMTYKVTAQNCQRIGCQI